MPLSCSERWLTRALPLGLLLAAIALPVPARAQEGLRRVVSSEISISRDEARLVLEFETGRRVRFALHDDAAWQGDERLGDAPRGSELDRSWRELLARAMDVSSDELAPLLASWEAPADANLDDRLDAALNAGTEPALTPAAPTPPEFSDSVERLVERITELQAHVEELQGVNEDFAVHVVDDERGNWFNRGPFRHVWRGLSGILSTTILYGVLFALAFATIFFGGRRYIEGVSDTARHATMRSLLVGLAASFLVIPVFILGIIALAISIVGIPALLAWIPLFPLAVGLSILLGYIATAHAAGESLAERRFHMTDWFQRGNSYYFLITGLGLLLSPFIAMHAVHMAGPWLGFLAGILMAVGVIATWAALSIGLGAVLISRAGTRPVRTPSAAEPGIYAEPTSA
jgi:hypothetical protein